MPPFATVEEFLGRISGDIVGDLTTPSDGASADEGRLLRALEDATAELEGWIVRLPEEHRPKANTLRVHCIKVALYLLTLDRPGKEFESIRNAYKDTIDFYTAAVAQAAGSGGGGAPVVGVGDAPDPVFGAPGAMKGFAP